MGEHVRQDCVRVRLGGAVQVVLIKPKLKAPGIKLLKVRFDEVLSSFAFNFNLCRYASGLLYLWTARPSPLRSATSLFAHRAPVHPVP